MKASFTSEVISNNAFVGEKERVGISYFVRLQTAEEKKCHLITYNHEKWWMVLTIDRVCNFLRKFVQIMEKCTKICPVGSFFLHHGIFKKLVFNFSNYFCSLYTIQPSTIVRSLITQFKTLGEKSKQKAFLGRGAGNNKLLIFSLGISWK